MDSIVSQVKKSLNKRKKCIVCEEREAEFYIKGIPKDCYCRACAELQFADLDLLERVE